MTIKIRSFAAALLAALPVAAPAQPAQPTQPAPPATAPATPAPPAPSPLSTIPGVTVTYYDVTGVTIEEMRASIAANGPRDAAGAAVPSTARWGISTNVQRATTGTRCRIVAATAVFEGQVVLPRLVGVENVPADVLPSWQAYIASLEQQQADFLRRPYSRISEVEQAVLASTCEGAAEASNRAIAAITAPPPPPPPPATPAPATPTPQQ